MKKRPLGVTIVCALIIIIYVMAALSEIYSLMSSSEMLPMQEEIFRYALFGKYGYYALVVIDVIVTCTCAIAMLYRKNWARITYIIYGFISLFLDPFIRSQGSVVPANVGESMFLMIATFFGMLVITLYLISVVVLMAPKAQYYFSNVEDKSRIMKRPVLLSIWCGLMTVLGSLSASTLFHHNSFLFRDAFAQHNFIFFILCAIIPMVAVMAILYAKKWGRMLYIAYFIVILLLNVAEMTQYAIMMQLGFLVVTLFILFSKKANKYFKGSVEPVLLSESV